VQHVKNLSHYHTQSCLVDILGYPLPQPGHLEKCEGAIPHFWAKIAPNRTILAKSHYYELFGQNPLFHTFVPKLHFFALFGKNHTSLKQNYTSFVDVSVYIKGNERQFWVW